MARYSAHVARADQVTEKQFQLITLRINDNHSAFIILEWLSVFDVSEAYRSRIV